MKQLYFFKTALLILILFSNTNIFSQTVFDLTNVTDNTPTNVSETISGVTMTVSAITSGTNNSLFVANSGFGTNGILAHNGSSTSNESVNITFDSAVDVASIHVNATNSYSRTWSFTPTGGSNSTIMDTRDFSGGPHEILLNFTGVTGISITSSSSGTTADQIVFDKVTLSQTLGIQDLQFSNKNIKIYPNPTNDFIKISGISKESFSIYNILGTEIRKGVISNNEQIDIRDFTNGLYFLKFDNGNTIKFLKE